MLQAIIFHRCQKLRVRDIALINSQRTHIAFTNSFRVVVSGIKMMAPSTSPNTDGLHISSSSRVNIKDSIIRTGWFLHENTCHDLYVSIFFVLLFLKDMSTFNHDMAALLMMIDFECIS